MDNKKIGKLIADLRKKQNLTQQELGDKVCVGFRAVSKWERGLTLPDITIINELSKILGITSDELLSGELNEKKKTEENKKKKEVSPKIKITISVITCIVLLLSSIIIYYNNQAFIYGMSSTNEDYYIEGQTIFKDDKLYIHINNLRFNDKTFAATLIKNYEYQITTGDRFIYGYGMDPHGNLVERETDVKTIAENFYINLKSDTKLIRKEVLNNNIIITISFTTIDDKIITKEIEVYLYINNKKET